MTDPEGAKVIAVVNNVGANYKLNLWVNEVGTYLYSNQLEESSNAELGTSVVTITYIDSITSAELNTTYVLEVLPRETYQRYKTLGLIEEEPTIET